MDKLFRLFGIEFGNNRVKEDPQPDPVYMAKEEFTNRLHPGVSAYPYLSTGLNLSTGLTYSNYGPIMSAMPTMHSYTASYFLPGYHVRGVNEGLGPDGRGPPEPTLHKNWVKEALKQLELPMGLRIGDVVKLKSGGPNMTITQANETSVYLVWIGNDGEARSLQLHPDALRLVLDDPP